MFYKQKINPLELDETFMEMFKFLKPEDLGNVARVSWRWNHFANDNRLWYKHYQAQTNQPDTLYQAEVNYKQLFKTTAYSKVGIKVDIDKVFRGAFSPVFIFQPNKKNPPILNIFVYKHQTFAVIEEMIKDKYYFRKLNFKILPNKDILPTLMSIQPSKLFDQLHDGYCRQSFSISEKTLSDLEYFIGTKTVIKMPTTNPLEFYKILFQHCGIQLFERLPLIFNLKSFHKMTKVLNIVDGTETELKPAPEEEKSMCVTC